jgi:nitrate/nitrite transporter NarK
VRQAIIGSFGYSTLTSNLLSTPVYLIALIITILVSLYADRTPSTRWRFIFWPALIGAASFALQAVAMDIHSTGLQYFALILNTSLSWSMVAVILAILTTILQSTIGLSNDAPGADAHNSRSRSSTAAATGTAFVVGFGNLGGFVGPKLLAVSIQNTGSYSNAMWALAALMALAALLSYVLERRINALMNLKQLAITSNDNLAGTDSTGAHVNEAVTDCNDNAK